MIKTEIFKLTAILQSGKKIAKVKNNRVINDVNVKEKVKSIKAYGLLQPIMVVEASKVIEQGLEIVDFETGGEINDPENYVVVIDGQHRLSAYNTIKKDNPKFDKDCFIIYSPAENVSIVKQLSEMNIQVRKWTTRDLVSGVVMAVKDKYQLITEINKLTSKGYSLEAAYKYLTLSRDVITRNELNKITNDEKLTTTQTNKVTSNPQNIQRGLDILGAIKERINEDFIKTRLIADWVVSKYEKTGDAEKATFKDDMCEFFRSLDVTKGEAIKSVTGKRGESTKEDKMFNLLNEYYQEYESSKQAA